MKILATLGLLTGLLSITHAAEPRTTLPVGPNPESVTPGFGGDLFVTLMGETRTKGDGNGRIVRVTGDDVAVFAPGFDDPKGLVFLGDFLITADFDRVWKIDATGRKVLLAGPEAFPTGPLFLNDVTIAPDGQGVLVTDMGAVAQMRGPDGQFWPLDSPGARALPVLGRVYRVGLDGRVSLVAGPDPLMPCPNGIAAPDAATLLVAEFFTGAILERRDGRWQVLATGHRGADGIARGQDGTIYVSEVLTGRVWALPPHGEKQLLSAKLTSAADFLLDEKNRRLVVPDTKAGALVFVPLPSPASVPVDLAGEPWRVWLDEQAPWKEDALYLPDEVNLAKLPVNAPSGGWAALREDAGLAVALPATVEEHFWGKQGERPYAQGEYFYWNSDPGPKNGNYLGVSWWWREFTAPALQPGQHLIVHFRGARLRAEVYVNQQLTGYSLLTELPFSADITAAVKTGERNQLAVRITNPGGFLDWTDWGPPIKWGKYDLPRSHGFGGLDAGITLEVRDAVAVTDLAVLNRPNPREVRLVGEVTSTGPAYRGPVVLTISRDGRKVWSGEIPVEVPAGNKVSFSHQVEVPGAELWDLPTPVLYQAAAALPGLAASARKADFGFRWFAPTGIHTDAQLRLNGRRIVLRSAISWGFWAPGGLWASDAMAEKEIRAAQALGLNTLQSHRNLGRPNLLDASDRLGLLRYEEPGAGKNAYTPLDQMGGIAGARSVFTGPPLDLTGAGGAPTEWRMRYEAAKILAMVRRDRSHPSVIVYCLQNEQNPPLDWPQVPWLFREIQKIDPSRTVYLHSGIPVFNQLVALPWHSELLHENGRGYSGWSDLHTVGGPGNYRDELYNSPADFSHRADNQREIVVWGEMFGVGVPDDHEKIVAWAREPGHSTYDLGLHERVLAGYNTFLDRWGFRGAFPTASALFRDVGAKQYYFWQKIMEQSRMSDWNDYLAFNGWESTSLENHSGLVDRFRDFRADPALVRAAAAPEILVVRPRRMTLAAGETAVVDVHLVSETDRAGPQVLRVRATAAAGRELFAREFAVRATGGDVFGELLQADIGFAAPEPGYVTVHAELAPVAGGAPTLERAEKFLVVDPLPATPLPARIAVIEPGPQIADMLRDTYGRTPLPAAAIAHAPLDAIVIGTGLSWSGRIIRRDEVPAGVPDPELYRFAGSGGPGLIGVWTGLATGLCQVEFTFIESYHDEAGKRLFDVALNGLTVLKDLDLRAAAGGRMKPLQKTFAVDLPAGELRIEVPRVAADRAEFVAVKITDRAGKVVALAFRDREFRDKTGQLWAPFGSSGFTVSDAQLQACLNRVEREGVRLVLATNGASDADVLAAQLDRLGVLKRVGVVGEARASWMGSWYFAKKHPLFAGLPADRVLGWEYQVPAAGPGVGGLLLEPVAGHPLDVVAGYSRDHEAQVGIGACTIRHGKGLIVLPALPGLRESLATQRGPLAQPIARRLLVNALTLE